MMGKVRKDGYWSGYREYRYGDQRRAKARAIYNPAQREHYAHKVAEILGTWKSSRWEREADTRAGIRSALCLAGNDWQRSDDEAAYLVAEGFRINGASNRPTYAEGQPGYTEAPDRCFRCGRPIDDPDMTRGQRFCSPECARAELNRRDFGQKGVKDAVVSAAYALINKRRAEPRQCVRCGEMFQTRNANARYCLDCFQAAAAASRTKWRREPIPCAGCGKPFIPNRPDRNERYCSKTCSAQHRAANPPVLPARRCECCDQEFNPNYVVQRFCSERCSKKVGNFWTRVRLGKARFGPLAFDCVIAVPANARPPRMTPQRFDELVAAG